MLQGQPAEQVQEAEDDILVIYQLGFFIFICFNFVFSVMNFSLDWHLYPPHEFCLDSGIETDIVKFFTYFLLPFVIISTLSIAFNTNFLQFPNLNQVLIFLNQVSMKSSIFGTLLFLTPMPSVFNGLGIIEMSKKVECLSACSIFCVFVALKGPLMLHWYISTEGQQADDQAPEEFEMQIV